MGINYQMLGCIVFGLILGYLLGRKDSKRIADVACDTAGKALLIAEEFRERLKEYEDD
jgi:hypothetical protein